MADLTRACNYAQKKAICVFAAQVVEGTDNDQILAASDNHLLAKLPPDSIILDSFIHVLTVSDAATSAVATLGTASGGSEILSAADLTTLGDQGTFTGQVNTDTGVDVWLGLTFTGAATEVAKYVVVVDYLEHLKNTGEYTQFN